MHCITPRTLVWACLFGIALFAAPAAGATGSGLKPMFDSVDASYVGPKTVHVYYNVLDTCDDVYDYCRYRLMGTPPGGGAQVELKAEQSSGGEYIFTGAYHHTGLDARTYSYSVIVDRYADGVRVQTATPVTTQATVTGDKAGGSLLFDEALEGTVSCAGLINVPEGITLSLGSTELTGGCYITVHGTLTMGADAAISGAQLDLYSPHSFEDLENVSLTFDEGSDGSSLTGGSNLTVVTKAALAIQGTETLTLTVNQPHGDVTVQKVTKATSPWIDMAADSRVTLDNIEWVGGNLSIGGACPGTDCPAIEGTFQARNLTAPAGLELGIGSGAGATIQDSFFRGPVSISAMTGHPTFTGNEFAGRVTVSQNTDATFTDNVFMDAMELQTWCWYGETPVPRIETNSFVGNEGLVTGGLWQCTNKIEIGANYYGDPDGPSMEGGQMGFLRRGAWVESEHFEVAAANVSGRNRSDTYVFPTFWLNNYLGEPRYRLGQGLVTGQYAPEAIQGKETLLSLDLVTSDQTVDNVRVYAVFDGQIVDPTQGSNLTLHRDSADYGHNANDLGRSTVNFILPATDKASVPLEVWLDTRGVTGYDTTGSLVQLQGLPAQLYFHSPPARPLRIAVIPVELPTGTANAGGVAGMLESLLPAMLPIPEGSVQARVLPTLVHRTTHWTTTGLLNSLASELALRRAFLNSYADNYGQPRDVTDFIVAVLPNGSLAGADGANMALRRGVVFVEDDKPEAAVHEMGHGIGLYNTVEQYNWPNYPDMGMPLQNVTAFLGVPSTASPAVNGSFSACDAGRICHIPSANVYWYSGDPLWYDIMGVGLLNQWPSAGTLDAFRTYFAGLTTTAAAAEMSPAGFGQAIAVIGQTQRVETVDGYSGKPCLDWRIVPDSVRIAEIAPMDAGLQPSSAPAGGGVRPASADATGDLPICSYSATSNLYLRYYNAAGELLSWNMLFNQVTGREAGRDYDAFLAPVTIYGTGIARFELAHIYNGPALAVFAGTGSLTTQILEPAAGSTLPGGASRAAGPIGASAGDPEATFTVRWQTTGEPPTGQALQHLIEYSTDGGVTWHATGLPIEGDQAVLPVSALPQSSNLSLRVTASDGIRSAAAQVTGLTRPNLPPAVTIQSPANGARGVTGTRWTLLASAYDPEDGSTLTGTWRTVTGTLGSGGNLSGLLLPVGAHTLTYEVVDQGGTKASASVQITVGPMPTVDLALPAGALAVQPPQSDPTVGTAVTLARGLTNRVDLRLHNTGTVVTATLSLYVTPPGGAETLLAQRALVLQPFERTDLVATLVPAAAGSHTFRGVVSGVTPTDTNPANNTRTWTTNAAGPATLAIVNPSPLDAGAGAVGYSKQVALTLANSGGSILTVRSLRFEGAGAGSFGLGQDSCSLATLAPGASCVVMVRFGPEAIGLTEAVLRIASSDPLQPERTLPVVGVGVAPKHVYLPALLRMR